MILLSNQGAGEMSGDSIIQSGAGDMSGESIIQSENRKPVRLFYYPIREQETCQVILLSNQGAGDISGESIIQSGSRRHAR